VEEAAAAVAEAVDSAAEAAGVEEAEGSAGVEEAEAAEQQPHIVRRRSAASFLALGELDERLLRQSRAQPEQRIGFQYIDDELAMLRKENIGRCGQALRTRPERRRDSWDLSGLQGVNRDWNLDLDGAGLDGGSGAGG
jgi:hypothetical protein